MTMSYKIIIGLGNPGKTYQNTRHNVGKLFLDYLAGESSWETSKKIKAEIIKKDSLVLVKPLIFMNQSGEAVKNIIGFYKTETKNILIVHDDSDLIFTKIKFAESQSSSAGHHGIESIEKVSGKKKFARIRIGIRPWRAETNGEGGPSKAKALDFVLKKFSKKDLEILEKEIFPKAKEILIDWMGSVE